VLMVAASLAIFVYGMIASMLGTVLHNLSERFKLTPSQNGTIALAQALGLILASLSVGPLLDNEGKKVGLILGLTVICFVLFLLPRSSGFRGILILLFALGIGGGIVVTAANALVSDVGEAHRATALNLANLFFGLGGFATPFIAANFFGKNWVRLCYTIASLAVIALAIQAVIQMPPPVKADRFVLAEAIPVLGHPLLFLLAFFLFLYITCEVGIWNWLPRHLIAQGFSESRALNILSVGFALGLLIGRMAVLPVLAHVPPVTVTLVGSMAMAVTTFLMIRAKQPTAVLALVFLAGLALAPVFPTTIAIVGNAFPRMTGTAIGFVITCGWAGLAVSSRVIGLIAGGDPRRLKTALMVIPASSVVMVGLDLAIRSLLR
jgi:fucose permease